MNDQTLKFRFFPLVVMQKLGLKDDENLALKSLFQRQLLTKYVSYMFLKNYFFSMNNKTIIYRKIVFQIFHLLVIITIVFIFILNLIF